MYALILCDITIMAISIIRVCYHSITIVLCASIWHHSSCTRLYNVSKQTECYDIIMRFTRHVSDLLRTFADNGRICFGDCLTYLWTFVKHVISPTFTNLFLTCFSKDQFSDIADMSSQSHIFFIVTIAVMCHSSLFPHICDFWALNYTPPST